MGRLWEAESEWKSMDIHMYVRISYLRALEQVRGTNSTVTCPGRAQLPPFCSQQCWHCWRPGCIAFRTASCAKGEGPKPHSSFQNGFCGGMRKGWSCRVRYRSGLRRGLHLKRGAAPPARLLAPAMVPPLAACGLSASACAWAWFDVLFAPLSAFHPHSGGPER